MQLFTCKDADAGVDVLPDSKIVAAAERKHKWLGVRGRPGVLQGAYEFAVQLPEACLVRVGWASANSSRVIGLDALSFGYGGTAIKSHDRKFEKYGEEYDSLAGAIVVCRIDRRDPEAETISYSLNGRDLGVAFEISVDLAGVPLFPAISGKESWSACVLASDPVDDQPYRPLCEAFGAAHAVAQPFTMGPCQEDADPCVYVDQSSMEVQCNPESGTTWYGVRARPGILRGRYQFQVELRSGCLVRVGWATLKSKRTIGVDKRSFGFGGTAKKSHGGKYEDYGEKFGAAGDVLSCLIDRADPHRQTVSYCLNGKELGVAFEIPEALLKEPLYPAVCGKAEWHVSVALSDFAHPVEGYMPVAEGLALRDAVVGETPNSLQSAPAGRRVVSKDRFLELKAVEALEAQHAETAKRKRKESAAEKFAPQDEVQPGVRVVVYVNSGPWSGWYVCRVLDIDPMGCYVKHEIDAHTENIPWSFLGGPKYDMDIIPEVSATSDKTTALAFSPALEEEVVQKQEGEGDVHAAADADAASMLRKGCLRVHADLGAGITLVLCDHGYFVSEVELPGQPDIKKGDVIVGIGSSVLLGLNEDEVTERFGEAFSEGANVILAPYIGLRPLPFSVVRQQVERLLLLQQPQQPSSPCGEEGIVATGRSVAGGA